MPTKMNTITSTSGSSTLGVLYDSDANRPASNRPVSTATIPRTVSQVIASHEGRVIEGSWNSGTTAVPPPICSMKAGCPLNPETRACIP